MVFSAKAPSTPATMSKQQATLSKKHSTLLLQTATMSNEFIVKFRPFDKVEYCFDNVAGFCNNVEQAKQIKHIQFVTTLSKGRNFVRHCCRNRQNCCQNGNNVEATFDIVERIVQLVVLDNVASTLLLV